VDGDSWEKRYDVRRNVAHTGSADSQATALVCGDEKISYGELDESSSRLACWLLEQGLQRGDRVGIHWCNSIEAVRVFFAAFKAGLIAVPINLRMKPPEVTWILEHSKSIICFSQPNLAHNVEQAASGSFCGVLTALPELIRGRGSACRWWAKMSPQSFSIPPEARRSQREPFTLIVLWERVLA
jgi:acyl-CoA synthetase (AMP-forming)/AMP-acid ligase II